MPYATFYAFSGIEDLEYLRLKLFFEGFWQITIVTNLHASVWFEMRDVVAHIIMLLN